MPVFKLSLKIIKQNLSAMSIYLIILLVMSIMLTSAVKNEEKKVASFDRAKEDIAFISEEDTKLVQGLKDELSKVANFIELENETNAMQDALFFRDVVSIIQIEEGFTEKFINKEEVSLEISNIPDSYSSVYIGMTIDQYLNTARLYLGQDDSLSQEELTKNVAEDLGVTTPVNVLETGVNSIDLNSSVYYFNFLAYSLLAVLIFGIGTIMVAFKDPDIQMRNNSSPYSVTRINMETILGIFVFTLITWLIMISFHFILNTVSVFSTSSLYFIINSLVFTFCGTGISFLLGTIIKSRDAISTASNVLTLGSSFIGGAFVPQELLGDFALRIGSFTPAYWYVRANNQIGSLTVFNIETLKPVYSSMIIQIGFGVLFFTMAIISSNKKRVK